MASTLRNLFARRGKDVAMISTDGSRNRAEPRLLHSEEIPLTSPMSPTSPTREFALYKDESNGGGGRPFSVQFIKNMSNTSPAKAAEPATKQKTRKLNTLLGVYLPSLQHIFGIILFIRLTWIVGTGGLIESFFIAIMCCLGTFLTAVSISAIATNGVMASGGPYFLISRNLGQEFGGAVGILYYLGITVEAAMYIIAGVELLLKYMAPQISIFGDIHIPANVFNNFRVYGTAFLVVLCLCVFVGVRFVSKIGALSLMCVLLSILAIYAGIFKTAIAPPDLKICMMGNRLLSAHAITLHGQILCTKDQFCYATTGNASGNSSDETLPELCPIFARYCSFDNATGAWQCDAYFEKHDVQYIDAIPGLKNSPIARNIRSMYTQSGEFHPGEAGDALRGEVVSDVPSNFMVLVAIFFPSVTGILAGCDRSGDLRDPSYSIPIGTIGAQVTTSLVYIGCTLFFAGCMENAFLRDKYGESIGGRLPIATISWPHEWIVLLGSFLSTLGAGLQCLTSGPRLLQAIATDQVMPFLSVFSVTSKRGEPVRALLLTAALAEAAILIASVDYVAPLLDMFFLMCYATINLACAVQTLLREPSWRPRFRYYHWTLSVVGFALCMALMFLSSWYFALVALVLVVCAYKYIEYKGAEKEYGDGIRGLSMSAARFALLRLEDAPLHTKNWRPQLLVLVELDEDFVPKSEKIVTFASQLKHGKGLTLLATILEGYFPDKRELKKNAKAALKNLIATHKVKGFAEVAVARQIMEGLSIIIQTAGLGGMQPNTIVIPWPDEWREDVEQNRLRLFVEAVRVAQASNLAVLSPKSIDAFPSNSERFTGVVDVWWIVYDGGLLMLLPFLLKQHKVWAKCKLRIFTVAHEEDDTQQMRTQLTNFIYQLRIDAEVDIVELADDDITAYTYDLTTRMEQRQQMLKALHLNSRRASIEAQQMVEHVHSARHVAIVMDGDPEESLPPAAADSRPNETHVIKMHNAVKLNKIIAERSKEAQLVIVNLPYPPKQGDEESHWMEYLEVMSKGLKRVLWVRGTDQEVITIFS